MSRIQTTLSGLAARPEEQQERTAHELAVNVAFTSERATVAALRGAAELASGLGARLRVIVPKVVPYGRDVDDPTSTQEFTSQQVLRMEREAGVDADVQIVLCRDKAEGLHQALGSDGLVVIGGPSRWWQFAERRLAHKLAALGHKILFVEGKQLMMLDLFYLAIAIAFFALTWAFTKVCDRL